MMEAAALKSRAAALVASVGLVWAVSLFGLLVDQGFVYDLALVPRRVDGLSGIFGMPFVHGSLTHLVANTVPLLVLGSLLVSRGVGYYLGVTLAIAVLGGLALWVFGREAAHIGASGLVFGFFGFLVVRGLYERRFQSLAVTALVIVVYGGMILGVLPRDDQVSWEGHLFGLLAGIAVARGAYAIDQRRSSLPRD